MKEEINTFEEFVTFCNQVSPLEAIARSQGVRTNFSEMDDNVIPDIEMIKEKILECVEEEQKISLSDVFSKEMKAFISKTPLGGSALSMIERKTLGLNETWKVKKFLKRNGINLDSPEDLKYITEIFDDAIRIFERYLIDKKGQPLKLNLLLKNIKTKEDIYSIFMIASGIVKNDNIDLVPQACALLRLAYVIDYIKRSIDEELYKEAYNKLHHLVTSQIVLTSPQNILDTKKASKENKKYIQLGGGVRIPIIEFKIRLKSLDSLVRKLLKNPEAEINFKDLLAASGEFESPEIAFLFWYHAIYTEDGLFPDANISPKDNRNTLINIEQITQALTNPKVAKKLFNVLASENITDDTFIDENLTNGTKRDTSNPFSHPTYKAIHVIFDLPITFKGRKTKVKCEFKIIDRKSKKAIEESSPDEIYSADTWLVVQKRILEANNLVSEYDEFLKRVKSVS
jgi:uncharacterized protein (TIGR04562 family)